MTEDRLQEIERELAKAEPAAAAAIAFAAIHRIGELGAPARDQFARLADEVFTDPDMTKFADGWALLVDVIQQERVS